MIDLPKSSLELLIACLRNNPLLNEEYERYKEITGKIYDETNADLVKAILNSEIESYTPDFYNMLRGIVCSEFCMYGLREDYEPNGYGLRLECLIDEIGHLFMYKDLDIPLPITMTDVPYELLGILPSASNKDVIHAFNKKYENYSQMQFSDGDLAYAYYSEHISPVKAAFLEICIARSIDRDELFFNREAVQ